MRAQGADRSVLDVVAYFDALVRDRVQLPELLRAAALFTGCPAGFEAPDSGECVQCDPDPEGDTRPVDGPPASTGVTPLGRPGTGGRTGRVWLARDGVPDPLDEVVLERLALAVELALERAERFVPGIDDPESLIRLALDSAADPTARARALVLLGFDPARPIRVFAAFVEDADGGESEAEGGGKGKEESEGGSDTGSGEAVARELRALGLSAHWARMGPLIAVLSAVAPDERLPAGDFPLRLGIGTAVPGRLAADSWAAARIALRFSVTDARRGRVTSWENLGVLTLLAEHIPDHAIDAQPDVRALERLAAQPRGQEVIDSVEALCRERSLRRAAVKMHLHHSSMAARIARAEAAMNLSLDSESGRLRAEFALLMLRLRGHA
ncbi:helix-turn-helix domain-containing protein [Streptomyces sp. NBC_00564]|uniref:helix-turn-helix domain-containing protein n=1 Tax=Streptomyces sp. NBC_00564 TaxID=2903663 RepID=UPI00352C5F2B|nr:helix-turn-helix domain-containing protein [Streptomyces sp. NBC_00564]